jgi:hypothetical protein
LSGRTAVFYNRADWHFHNKGRADEKNENRRKNATLAGIN